MYIYMNVYIHVCVYTCAPPRVERPRLHAHAHLDGSSPTTEGRCFKRVTHGHVSFHRHGDDEPHGIIADRIPEHIDRLTRPLGDVLYVISLQFRHPQSQQSDEQHQSISDGQRRHVQIRRHPSHGRHHEDNEREQVPDGADDEQYRRYVEQQQLVELVFVVLHQLPLQGVFDPGESRVELGDEPRLVGDSELTEELASLAVRERVEQLQEGRHVEHTRRLVDHGRRQTSATANNRGQEKS